MNPITAQHGGDVIYALRRSGADIHDFTSDLALNRHDKRVDDILHIGEIPRLRAIADNGQRLARQFLRQKYAEHGAITAGGTRTRAEYVEGAERIRRQTVCLAPMHDHLLAEIFGQRVRVHGVDRRGFGRWKNIGQAVAG